MNLKRLLAVVLIVPVLLLLLASCGEKPQGYGVLLWMEGMQEPGADMAEGQIYPVYQESNIRNTYELAGKDAPPVSVERWRMEYFTSRPDAEKFAEAYIPLLKIYGETRKSGQAVRKAADAGADRIYKLREGQVVKIIEKLPELAREGSLEDYWYRVLTDDGTMGYCFGGNLEIFDADVREAQKGRMEIDSSLDTFLSKPFRPEEFRKMVIEKRIDLSRFTPEVGSFPDLAGRVITVVTPEETFTFPFDRILTGEPGHFLFGDSGLDITVINSGKVVLHYDNKGAPVDQVYVALDGMNELIDQEKERQKALFLELYYMGPGVSSAYGTISFDSPLFESLSRFVWENRERLSPSVIPEGLSDAGTLEILYYPVQELQDRYDGVFTMNFSPAAPSSRVNFLYELTDRGLRLVYVPEKDIRDGLVQRVSASPLIMFFSADNPRPREEIPAEGGDTPAE